MSMQYPSKAVVAVSGIVAIALGAWALMYKPDLVQIIAILLILMGVKKLVWSVKGCC